MTQIRARLRDDRPEITPDVWRPERDLPYLRQRMSELIARHVGDDALGSSAIPGVTLHQRTTPSAPMAHLHEPSLCVIASGGMRVVADDETYLSDADHVLLAAVELPTHMLVTAASEAEPFRSLRIAIDLEMARELIMEIDLRMAVVGPRGRGVAAAPVTPELAGSTLRLLELLDTPADIPILAPAIQREVLYRVLTGPSGARMRRVVLSATRVGRATKAVRWVRENYTRPFHVNELAATMGMGVSTLHRHFQTLTSMSPLQFQKHLRLHEARRLLLNERLDVATAAIRVGYESVTQFSREYKRVFGASPRADIRRLLMDNG